MEQGRSRTHIRMTRSGVAGQDGSTANNYMYCGEQYDYELGTYYLRARYMNPIRDGFGAWIRRRGAKKTP